ncbi:MAG: DNA alkylation repair protein [Clostridia bacterium]|nr:DNA alkylation repair protein [Clostridia bacterium]MDY6184444.1 DNA alkylation repair protein [Eubacteriales bacterium]
MKKSVYFDLLSAMADPTYAAFQARLMPTVKREKILGVRMPAVRALAHRLRGDPAREEFLSDLPHAYYDEDNLHAFLLMEERDFGETVRQLDAFLPCIDNWATCDSLTPKCFSRHLDELLPAVERWLASSHVYTRRFGIEMLMKFYLDDAFSPAYLARVAALDTPDYYLETMVAWYFATALAKQYEATLPYFREGRLSPAVRKRAIRKAQESYRLSPAEKAEVRAYL